MKLTRHAQKQAQRRAIDTEVIELVISYGEEFKAGDGCRFYRLPLSEMRFLKHDCSEPLWRRYRDRLRKVTPLLSPGQEVVTAMHRFMPLWKRRGWSRE